MQLVAADGFLGAVVTGVDLTADIDDDTAHFLRQALDDRGVLCLPGQPVDDAAQQRVAGVWAQPSPHPVVEFLGGDEVMGVVFNDADHPPHDGGGDSFFHTDYSFNHEIPDVAVLRATVIPPVGGNTTWADARAALRSLDPALVGRLRRLQAHHAMPPRFAVEMEVRFGSELAARVVERFGPGSCHPVVSSHPRTGDELLFVNPGFTRSVEGLEDDESQRLLEELFAAFSDPAFQFEQSWQPDDLVVWDEHRTVHRGPNDFGPHSRELRRCTAGRRAPEASMAA